LLGTLPLINQAEMAGLNVNYLVVVLLCVLAVITTTTTVVAEDPYRFFNWNVTYGDIYPLGVRQQVCFFTFIFDDIN
jgi:hypothetical protein